MPVGEVGKVFADGEIIFRQGEVADCLYIIQSGNVVIYQEKDGREIPLAELGKGDSFGDMGVFMGPVHTESARSKGGARVITADYKFVLKKFRDDPSFAFQIIETIAQRDRGRVEAQEKTLEELHVREQEAAASSRKSQGAYFYDFAPVAAIDLDEKGIIRGVNLSGAAMLGTERGALMGMPFDAFVSPGSQDRYRNHLEECNRASEGVITELFLDTRKGLPAKVQIFSYPKREEDRVVYRTLMTELSSRQEEGGETKGR